MHPADIAAASEHGSVCISHRSSLKAQDIGDRSNEFNHGFRSIQHKIFSTLVQMFSSRRSRYKLRLLFIGAEREQCYCHGRKSPVCTTGLFSLLRCSLLILPKNMLQSLQCRCIRYSSADLPYFSSFSQLFFVCALRIDFLPPLYGILLLFYSVPLAFFAALWYDKIGNGYQKRDV